MSICQIFPAGIVSLLSSFETYFFNICITVVIMGILLIYCNDILFSFGEPCPAYLVVKDTRAFITL